MKLEQKAEAIHKETPDISESLIDGAGETYYHRTEGANLLTLEEVCKLLKVSKAYIYSLTHQKRIPHIKMMGHLRFRKCEMDDWLRDQEQEVCIGNTKT